MPISSRARRAVWVRRALLAWPPASDLPQPGEPRGPLRWRLHWSTAGGLGWGGDHLGGMSVELSPAGDVPSSVVAEHPQLAGHHVLLLPAEVAGQAEQILTGDVAVAAIGPDGQLAAAVGIQPALVLDDLYAASARTRCYGAVFDAAGAPTFRLWAPTATQVTLLTWPRGSPDTPAAQACRRAMTRADDGSWSVSGTFADREARYLYEVLVHVPTTGRVETNVVTDPYSVALTLNSTRSVAVDLADSRYRPALWSGTPAPPPIDPVDVSIYELHVRDFSICDPQVPVAHRGSYLAFAADGLGRRHLQALAEAGLTSVHLLPTFDIATIEEDPQQQAHPVGDLAACGPASDQQQRGISATGERSAYNWGYDPWHWLAPEGSYASTGEAADGGLRVAEFRTMVGALHADGLRVVLDQVFNHVPQSGQGPRSVLDRIVPGYYHRLDPTGRPYTSTCCENVATERVMAEKLMVDAVVSWARHYRVDGFRFDLMGHHSRANLIAVQAALAELTIERDGVDGAHLHLYGEGWSFGEVAGNARFVQASQGQLAGTRIGTFSDRLRDAVRGGRPFGADPGEQGFGSGLAGPPTDAADPVRARALARATDLVQLGLAGNLAAYEFTSQERGIRVRGDQVDYVGAPAGYAAQPQEIVTYVDAHDNETLFDVLTMTLPRDTTMGDRVRMNTLCLALVALSQTTAFWHAGTDLLRSKSFDRNSYRSGDWFNRIDWSGQDNGFGRGLPPEPDNGSRWPLLAPLLGDPGLRPGPQHIAAASAMARDLLRLRYSTKLFRLGSAELIGAKVSFPVSGTEHALPGVIVLLIDDTVGPDVDPALDAVVVAVNATAARVEQLLPALRDVALQLSPVQARGSDPVVRTATWAPDTAYLGVPARSVVVFERPTARPGSLARTM